MSEQDLNHADPAAPAGEAPCETCATSGEKLLAVLSFAFAAVIILMAVDMFSGGKVSGFVAERRQQ